MSVLERVDQKLAPSPLVEIAIQVREVGKMYRIYDHPQDRLKQMLLWRLGRQYGREFWALRDISFDVRRGEAVGIIGRNGSGKSTLLQIIAGTLSPSQGEAQVNGRVAALLELGSGFNPEFTGRENVYMNGAILGLSQADVRDRFDAIAAFADIGDFIDQPVKYYSSGMAVRLAFAVQAVIQKDVLIVDEALAVGDEAFQRKCMRHLEDFRASGGSVLLVTHSVQTIVRQCERCVFLHGGRKIVEGPSKDVTDLYQRFLYGTPREQQQILATPEQVELRRPDEGTPVLVPTNVLEYDPSIPQTSETTYGNGAAQIMNCRMEDVAGNPVNVLIAGRRYRWRYEVRFNEAAANANFGMALRALDGLIVSGINSYAEGHRFAEAPADATASVTFDIQINLAPGTYYTEAGVVGETATPRGEGGFLHRRVDISAVRIVPPDSRPINGVTYTHPNVEVVL
jgi:lipopolysaccharide transport system ATP-binding protein